MSNFWFLMMGPMMSEQKKDKFFPDGWSVKPLYDTCPKCGCDLNKFIESSQDHASPDDVENYSDRAGSPGGVDQFDSMHVGGSWVSRFVKWMVNPLSNTKNDAAKGDYEGLSRGIRGKKSGTVQKDDERTNHN